MSKIRNIILLLLLSHATIAQVYLKLYSGYALATYPYVHQNRVITDSIIDLFKVKFAYGKGMNLGIAAGYLASENFSAELIITTALFTTSTSNHDWDEFFRRDYIKLHLSGLNGDAEMKNFSLQIAPLLVYSVRSGKIQPFLKCGINMLYVKSAYRNSYTYRYHNENSIPYLEHTDLRREYTGGINLGFRGSIGTFWHLTDNIALFGEFMAINTMYDFRESRTLSFVVDGVEMVEDLEENPVKLNNDEGRIDYSHIGLNAGIRYVFGKD